MGDGASIGSQGGGTRPHLYFATASKAEIGSYLANKIKDCVNDNVNTLREEYATAYRSYYGRDMGFGVTTGITREGEQGELASLRVNESRSNLKALHSIVTGPKVTWRPTARNSDSGAQASTTVAKHLLEDEWKSRGVSGVFLNWVEQALAFSEAFVFPEWDRGLGAPLMFDQYDADAQERYTVFEGDIRYHNILPWDIFRDNRAKTWGDLEWVFIRIYKNRWNLAKMHRRLIDGTPSRDKILSAKEDELLRALDVGQRGIGENTDLVPCWYFFHKPSPVLPKGRETILLHGDCVLWDRALTYCDPEKPEWPLVRLAADEMFDTAHGWTPYWDTLGPQEALDSLETAVTTNETSLAVQSIAYEHGTEIKAQDTVLGMRAMKYPKGARPPEALQLTKSPPEVFEHMKILRASMRALLGLNDAAMGQPQTSQMNAQAFAVLVSMAVQIASPMQTRCLEALSELGTKILKIKRARVTRPRILQVLGDSNSNLFSEESYTGQTLKPVERTHCEIGNPMEQNPAGRALILQTMAQAGIIHNAEELQQVVETGRIEPATRGLRDELLLIQSEYELLSKGTNPPVHAVQNHPLHYRENAAVLHNPESLKNPQVVQAVQAHLDMHYQEYYGMPPQEDPDQPNVLAKTRFLLGLGPAPQPSPPPGAPQGPPGPGGPPPGPPHGPPQQAGPHPPPGGKPGVAPAAPPGGNKGPAMQAMQAMTPPGGGPPTPNLQLPSMPKNPVSGAPFEPVGGGLK